MKKRKQAIYQPSNRNTSLRQGEILTNVIQYCPVIDEKSRDLQELPFKPIIHPYVIVVTQDCDLDWDYTARQGGSDQLFKLLNSIIVRIQVSA